MQTLNRLLLSLLKFIVIVLAIVCVSVIGGIGGYYVASTRLPTQVREEPVALGAIRKVKPAVVTIVNKTLPNGAFTGQELTIIAYGSGVVIDSAGFIVTNYHVVNLDDMLWVIFPSGQRELARVIGEDSVSDIAVIQVKKAMPAVAHFGDSSQLEPGQVVIAIGSPLDEFHGTVTMGIVSGLNRKVGGIDGLIQTDAAINKGNSGGPLIDLNGQIMGINTLTVRTASDSGILEGLGFAVPSNKVREIVNPWIEKGRQK
ncbi:MAG: trypsin-like peptidase domain-containing protein [Chloroflexi bacterium]|nr:trypsin-like peptidase domain-containing protein [Chloroflexota bacterium]